MRVTLLLKDSNYTRTVRTWVKKEGQLTPVEKQQRILPWWRVNADGSYVLFVRSGSKTIEFEKGKNAVAVPSFDKVLARQAGGPPPAREKSRLRFRPPVGCCAGHFRPQNSAVVVPPGGTKWGGFGRELRYDQGVLCWKCLVS
jgi:hypothetical protein